MPKRCERGTRRNKKTGECEAYNRVKSKRCKRGTRRNKKTGECESYIGKSAAVQEATETRYPILSVEDTKIPRSDLMQYCENEYGDDWQIHYEEIEALIVAKVRAQVPGVRAGQNGGEILFDGIPITKKLKSFTFPYLDKTWKVEWSQ